MRKYLARKTNEEKAKAWDGPLSALPPMIDPTFRWMTQDGDVLTTREMSTWHLFNSLKMIWNHTIPIQFRFLPYKPYKGIINWNPKLRRRAISCLFHELTLRPDRTKKMDEVIATMQQYILHHKQECLHTNRKTLPDFTNG